MSLLKTGVFNLSDSAGHINNFNDARGSQSYDVHVHTIGKSGRSVNLTTNRYIICRQRTGLAFVVIFSKRPAGHGKGLRGPHVARGPRVEDPCSTSFSDYEKIIYNLNEWYSKYEKKK
jgi:hypothetical protein